MTPRQLALLFERYQQKAEYDETLNGLICSTVANWSMAAPEKPLSHLAFMPSEWAKEPKEPKEKKKRVRKLNAEQVGNVFKNMFSGAVVNG